MPTMPASTGASTGIKRKARFLAANEEHFFAHAGADWHRRRPAVAPGRLAARASAAARCSSLRPVEVLVLARGDDVADDSRQLHCIGFTVSSRFVELDLSMMPTIGGVDRAVLQAGRHARRAAADDEHGFADAGVDRVDRDEVAALGLAARIHRPRDEQLAADEPRILAGRDDGPDDLRQEHSASSVPRSVSALAALADRQRVLEVGVRTRDHVHRHELADAAGGRGAPASVAAFTAATSPRTMAVT